MIHQRRRALAAPTAGIRAGAAPPPVGAAQAPAQRPASCAENRSASPAQSDREVAERAPLPTVATGVAQPSPADPGEAAPQEKTSAMVGTQTAALAAEPAPAPAPSPVPPQPLSPSATATAQRSDIAAGLWAGHGIAHLALGGATAGLPPRPRSTGRRSPSPGVRARDAGSGPWQQSAAVASDGAFGGVGRRRHRHERRHSHATEAWRIADADPPGAA
eukprot:SAG11_NODE_4799_length_1763_cov_1.771034_3_plen_217_part_01